MIFTKIKYGFIILIILFSISVTWWGIRERNEKIRWKSNYKAKSGNVIVYKDKLGRQVTQVNELRITNKELKILIYSKDSTLKKIGIELQAMKIKTKRVENLLYIELNSSGSGSVILKDSIIFVYTDTIRDTVKIEKIKYADIQDDWLTLKVEIRGDTLKYGYLYKDEILAIGNMKKNKFREDGKKYFFLRIWLGLLPKEYVMDVKSLNPNSEITTVIKIETQKRKGKRNR